MSRSGESSACTPRTTLARMNMDGNAEPLTLGAVVEPSVNNRPWLQAIRALTLRIAEARVGAQPPLGINVVFHIAGTTFKPDFSGVRTARYANDEGLLMVQVALPESVPADPEAYLRSAVVDAIKAAESWAAKRTVDIDAAALYAIVEQA